MNLMQSILAIKEDVNDTLDKLTEFIQGSGEIWASFGLGSFKDNMYDKLNAVKNNYGSRFSTAVNDTVVACRIKTNQGVATLSCYTPSAELKPYITDNCERCLSEAEWCRRKFQTLQRFIDFLNEVEIEYAIENAEDYWAMETESDWEASDDLQEFALRLEPYLCNWDESFKYDYFYYDHMTTLMTAYQNDTQDTIVADNLLDINGDTVLIDDFLNSLSNSSQLQDFMRIVCDCLTSGETNVTKISSILSNTANSYSNEVASMIQGFLSSIPADNSQGISAALVGLYSNMNRTKANETNNTLEFYQGSYMSATLFNSVWKVMYTTAAAVLQTVSLFISPILHAAIAGINALVGFTKQISENEDFIITDESINRAFGVPLAQSEISDDDLDHPFSEEAISRNAICVQTPLFYYNIWVVGESLRYEVFPSLLYSKTTLKLLLEDYLGFSDNYSDVITRTQIQKDFSRSAIWRILFSSQNEGAFQNSSLSDKLYILRATYILIILLGNDDTFSNNNIDNFYPGVPGSTHGTETITIGESLNYFLNESTRFNSWNSVYTFVTTYYSQYLANTILMNPTVSSTVQSWAVEANYSAEGLLENPLVLFTGVMLDRNNMFCTPPKWARGSIAWALGITVALTTIIIATAITVKREIRSEMRIKYAQISAAQQDFQNSIGNVSYDVLLSKSRNIDKMTWKYNKLAGLFGYSKLSYLNGWESGDSGMIQNPNRFTSVLTAQNNSVVTVADVIALIRG